MTTAGKLAWGAVILTGIIHFDFWAWDDDTLVFGFVPSALAFHAALSVMAAISWALVVRFDWPDNVEAWAVEGDSERESDAGPSETGQGGGA